MSTEAIQSLSQLRLMQLVSPSLPVGAYAYSQGLEWAVESGWVNDPDTLRDWTGSLLTQSLGKLDLPIMARLFGAYHAEDHADFCRWSMYLTAARETRELREEERQRARSLAALLPNVGVEIGAEYQNAVSASQLAGFTIAAAYWRISLPAAATGYVYAWLDNSVLNGVKTIPLGQTAGQRIIAEILPDVPAVVDSGLTLSDEDIGGSCPAQAIASSLHETQYTRIFRS